MHMFNNNRENFDKFISSINKIISLLELAIFFKTDLTHSSNSIRSPTLDNLKIHCFKNI